METKFTLNEFWWNGS